MIRVGLGRPRRAPCPPGLPGRSAASGARLPRRGPGLQALGSAVETFGQPVSRLGLCSEGVYDAPVSIEPRRYVTLVSVMVHQALAGRSARTTHPARNRVRAVGRSATITEPVVPLFRVALSRCFRRDLRPCGTREWMGRCPSTRMRRPWSHRVITKRRGGGRHVLRQDLACHHVTI